MVMIMTNFENLPNEKRPIRISSEEWKNFANRSIDDPELTKWLVEKGISFGDGFIEIELDGEKKKMVTSKEDFGTIID